MFILKFKVQTLGVCWQTEWIFDVFLRLTLIIHAPKKYKCCSFHPPTEGNTYQRTKKMFSNVKCYTKLCAVGLYFCLWKLIFQPQTLASPSTLAPKANKDGEDVMCCTSPYRTFTELDFLHTLHKPLHVEKVNHTSDRLCLGCVHSTILQRKLCLHLVNF